MKTLQEKLGREIIALLKDAYELSGVEPSFSIPAERKFGDLSTTLAFALAKKTGNKPFMLAGDIAARLQGKLAAVEEVRVAGGGFLNFFLRRDDFFLAQRRGLTEAWTPPARMEKVIVEHTSINPNKSAHIGHLRNSCLGDSLARCCRFLGYEVEVQNYIDDTGIQVADVVWGLLHHRSMDLDAIRRIPDLAAYLWELYAEVNRLFAADEALAAQRREVHRRIEEKAEPEYATCLYVAEQVLLDHVRTMERLGIRYDLLARESDVIALDFFQGRRRRNGGPRRDGSLLRSRETGLPGHPLRPGKDREDHRPLQRHHHLRGQGHRLQPLEIRPVGARLSLPALSRLSRRPSHRHDRVRAVRLTPRAELRQGTAGL